MDFLLIWLFFGLIGYLYFNYFRFHGPAYAVAKIVGRLFKLGVNKAHFKRSENDLQSFVKKHYSKKMNYEEVALHFYLHKFIKNTDITDDDKVFTLPSYFQCLETIASWTTSKKISDALSKSGRVAIGTFLMNLAKCMEQGPERYKLELMILEACKSADE